MKKFEFDQADIDAFKSELAQFHAKSEAVIGEIVRAHLIVEYYLNVCLAACYPNIFDGENELRLSFHQKVHLIPGWCFGFPWIRSAALDLNRLRNKVAHNIHFTVTDHELAGLEQTIGFMAKLDGGEPKGMQLVKAACEIISTALFSWSKKISSASSDGVGAYHLLMRRGEVD
jgi:hypothetical protein